MRISTRLYSLAAFGILGLLIMTLTAYRDFSSIRDENATMQTQILPSVQRINQIEAEFAASRRAVLQHILAGPEGKAKYLALFQQARKNILEHIEYYNTHLVADDKDRQNMTAVQREFDTYYAEVPAVFALSDQGRQEEARAMSAQKVTPVSEKTGVILEQAVEHNRELLAEANQALGDAIAHGNTMLISTFAVVGLILLAASLWTLKKILLPLTSLRDGLIQLSGDYDFTRRFERKEKDEINEAFQALNALLGVLQASFTQLRSLSQNVNQTAHAVASASTQMTSASQHVSESSSSMSAAVEQMTVSITHVADRAQEADQRCRESGTEANTGGEVIHDTIGTFQQTMVAVQATAEQITRLKTHTTNIGTVVNVIKDIADQTNLLALNAAIEAARAGELGRGFAVVADEVRLLAERTAQSTQEITGTVHSIQEEAGQTVEAMRQVVNRVEHGMEQASQATEAIQRIIDGTGSAVSQVSEISGSMREQSLASTNISQQVERIAQMMEENHASATNTTASAEELKQVAQEMHGTIEKFRI